MRGRRLVAAALVAGVGAVGGGAVGAPAQADCVYIVAYVSREGTTPIYVTNGCVANQDTPWRQRLTTTQRFIDTGHVPAGTPNGVFVDARLPVPG